MSNNNTDNPVESQINNWDDLNLNETLLRGIYSCGFEKPSEIQKKAILPIINGNDVIAQAQSGTGKTGCFIIGTLTRLIFEEETTQAIIISPTRELSIQTFNVFNEIGTYIKNLKICMIEGEELHNFVPKILKYILNGFYVVFIEKQQAIEKYLERKKEKK